MQRSRLQTSDVQSLPEGLDPWDRFSDVADFREVLCFSKSIDLGWRALDLSNEDREFMRMIDDLETCE